MYRKIANLGLSISFYTEEIVLTYKPQLLDSKSKDYVTHSLAYKY